MPNIVVELEFPWDDGSTEQEQRDFGELCLKLISDGSLGFMSPKGGVLSEVRVVQGSMAVARAATRGKC